MNLVPDPGRTFTPLLITYFACSEFRMRRRQLSQLLGFQKLSEALPSDWAIPDSDFAARAVEVATGLCPAFMIQHSFRAYCFGAILAARNGLRVDRETFFVAAMLHDLGLSDAHADDPGSFEWVGANLAYKFCLNEKQTETRAALIHNAIALHTSAGIADLYPSEISLLHFGTGTDLFGMRLGEIPQQVLREVLAKYPRGEFKQQFTPCLQHQADTKPNCHIAGAMALGLPGMVRDNLQP